MNIELRDYKYKELCVAMGEPIKTGKSKQLQIANWKRFFQWIHPSKQIYRIIEIFDVPLEKSDGRKKNGGARVGAGAPTKAQKEFEYIFKCFLYWLYSRQKKHFNCTSREFYFTYTEASIYFGIHSKEFYNAYSDDDIDKAAFIRIADKLREKMRSWILNKMKHTQGIVLTEGIIAYTNKQQSAFEYRDDYLESWKKYQATYLELHRFSSIKRVIEYNRWSEMIQYISQHYHGYEEVIKCYKIICSESIPLEEMCLEEYIAHKNSLNQKVVLELEQYFEKKRDYWSLLSGTEYNADVYLDVIRKYVLIEHSWDSCDSECDEQKDLAELVRYIEMEIMYIPLTDDMLCALKELKCNEYGYSLILKTFQWFKHDIMMACQRPFSSTYGKFKYILAIVKSRFPDTQQQLMQIQKSKEKIDALCFGGFLSDNAAYQRKSQSTAERLNDLW